MSATPSKLTVRTKHGDAVAVCPDRFGSHVQLTVRDGLAGTEAVCFLTIKDAARVAGALVTIAAALPEGER